MDAAKVYDSTIRAARLLCGTHKDIIVVRKLYNRLSNKTERSTEEQAKLNAHHAVLYGTP